MFFLCYSDVQYVLKVFFVIKGVCFNHVFNVYCHESHHSIF